MKAIPLTLAEANRYVVALHRHHQPMPGCKWSIGAVKDGRLVGVAMTSRPVARMIDQDRTLEVSRVCTDGTANACSFLYGSVRRAAFAMGYARVITYTLPEEGGASLRGAGWRMEHLGDGGQWTCSVRSRPDYTRPLGAKCRYAVYNPQAVQPGADIDFGVAEPSAPLFAIG